MSLSLSSHTRTHKISSKSAERFRDFFIITGAVVTWLGRGESPNLP